jgi:hypothetical protein
LFIGLRTLFSLKGLETFSMLEELNLSKNCISKTDGTNIFIYKKYYMVVLKYNLSPKSGFQWTNITNICNYFSPLKVYQNWQIWSDLIWVITI